jgi:hypothetical protein
MLAAGLTAIAFACLILAWPAPFASTSESTTTTTTKEPTKTTTVTASSTSSPSNALVGAVFGVGILLLLAAALFDRLQQLTGPGGFGIVLQAPPTPSDEDKEKIAEFVTEALREATGAEPSPEAAARVSADAILQAQAQLFTNAWTHGAPVAFAEPARRHSRTVGASRIVVPEGIVSAGGVPDLSDEDIRHAIANAIEDAAAPSSDDAPQK